MLFKTSKNIEKKNNLWFYSLIKTVLVCNFKTEKDLLKKKEILEYKISNMRAILYYVYETLKEKQKEARLEFKEIYVNSTSNKFEDVYKIEQDFENKKKQLKENFTFDRNLAEKKISTLEFELKAVIHKINYRKKREKNKLAKPIKKI